MLTDEEGKGLYFYVCVYRAAWVLSAMQLVHAIKRMMTERIRESVHKG